MKTVMRSLFGLLALVMMMPAHAQAAPAGPGGAETGASNGWNRRLDGTRYYQRGPKDHEWLAR